MKAMITSLTILATYNKKQLCNQHMKIPCLRFQNLHPHSLESTEFHTVFLLAFSCKTRACLIAWRKLQRGGAGTVQGNAILLLQRFTWNKPRGSTTGSMMSSSGACSNKKQKNSLSTRHVIWVTAKQVIFSQRSSFTMMNSSCVPGTVLHYRQFCFRDAVQICTWRIILTLA